VRREMVPGQARASLQPLLGLFGRFSGCRLRAPSPVDSKSAIATIDNMSRRQAPTDFGNGRSRSAIAALRP